MITTAHFFLLLLGASLNLVENSLLVRSSKNNHRVVKNFIESIMIILMSLHVVLDLFIEFWDEVSSNTGISRSTKCANVHQDLESIAFESFQEVLGEIKSNLALLLIDHLSFSKSHLHHATINLSILSHTGLF